MLHFSRVMFCQRRDQYVWLKLSQHSVVCSIYFDVGVINTNLSFGYTRLSAIF